MSTNESMSAAVASICTGLDELAMIDVPDLPDQVVRDELLALVRARRQLDAQIWARTAAFDARDLARSDGCRDVKAFLHGFSAQPATTTGKQLARGRLLRDLPVLARAAAEGSVGVERLRVVQQLAKDVGVAKLTYLDEYLTDAVTTATGAEFTHACDRVRAELFPDGRPPDDKADHERRQLSVFRHGPHVKVNGLLDLEGGAALLTALDAVLTPPGPEDERTPTQRRADALGELARRQLDAASLPTTGGERPHLGVLITPTALTHQPGPAPTLDERATAFLHWLNQHNPAGPANTVEPDRPGGEAGGDANTGARHADRLCGRCRREAADPVRDKAWLEWVGDIPVELARRLACDAQVWRAVLDPATGLPLDVGRAYRTAPHWIRRALHTRDRTCRFPGCTVPAAWTDVHHLDHWIDGGHTDIERLLALCRFHHRLVHEDGWRIEFSPDSGQVRSWRPDGTPYELGPSQPWTDPTTQRHHGAGPPPSDPLTDPAERASGPEPAT